MKQTDKVLVELADHFRKRLKHARLRKRWDLIESLEQECAAARNQILKGEVPMGKTKVWKDASGAMYHDECFEDGESREGFELVDLNDLEDDDACESCGGEFLAGPDTDEGNEDEEVEEENEVETPNPPQTA